MTHSYDPTQLLLAFQQLFTALNMNISIDQSTHVNVHSQLKINPSHHHNQSSPMASTLKHTNYKNGNTKYSNFNEVSINSLSVIQFISQIDHTQLPMSSVIMNNRQTGAQLHNYRLVIKEIQRFSMYQLKEQHSRGVLVDINRIVIHHDKGQLCKLLKYCFIMATKAANSSYFIEKILELNQNTQMIFAVLIQQQCDTTHNNYYYNNSNRANSPTSLRYQSPSRKYSQPKSPTNTTNKSAMNTNRQNSMGRQHALDLIDKLYQSQCQNEYLQAELQKSHGEIHQLKETMLELCTKIQMLKEQNQLLKRELSESVQATKSKNNHKQTDQYQQQQQQQQQQIKNQQCRAQLQNLLSAYRDQIQHHTAQFQASKRKHQSKINQLQLAVEKQRQINMRLKDELEYYQSQMQELVQKYTQIQKLQKEHVLKMGKLERKVQQLEETNAMLKFEISYKNVQVQEMRELLAMDLSDGVADDADGSSVRGHYYQDCQDDSSIMNNNNIINKAVDHHNDAGNLSRRTSVGNNHRLHNTKSSKILTADYLQLTPNNRNHIESSPNLRKTKVSYRCRSKQDIDEMDKLRNQIKQLKKQNQSIRMLRNTVKQLEYQRNKLGGILKQYESNRGEENQIITGCIYELRMKMANGINSIAIINNNNNNSQNKINFSRSTDHGHDISH